MSDEKAGQETQESPDKVQKNYDAMFRKLVAILGGEENLASGKVEKDTVGTIVTGLLKERREQTEKEVKDGLLGLLDSHAQFKKLMAEKERELKKLKETKQKEFIEAAQKTFKKIDGLNELEASYYSSFKEAMGGGEQNKP